MLETELIRILQAIEIGSPTQLRFLGQDIPLELSPGTAFFQQPAMPQAGGPPADQGLQALVGALSQTLYSRCYTFTLDDPPYDASAAPPDPQEVLAYQQRLSAGNLSRDRWDPDWSIYSALPDGRLSVRKGERNRFVSPGEYVMSVPGHPLQVGMLVNLVVPRESFEMQPGFYYCFGDTLADQLDEFELVRFYLHAPPEVAPDWVGALSTELNHRTVPFRMKTISQPGPRTRSDALVLYVARRYFRNTAQFIAEQGEDLMARLRPGVPLFTKCLAPGVGLAEDPGNNESFGMHRCRVLAQAVIDAWTRGVRHPQEQLASIHGFMLQQGVDLQRPWLNPGSRDIYEIPRMPELAL